MKLLKFSIFLTFVLSLLGAGLTFYLSNVRENEKEKRLYLEGVRTKLESEVQTLQSEVQKLGAENQELQQKLTEEQDAKEQVLALVHDRDSAMKQLEQEAQSARQAFEEAEKRNQELEKILNDLEARMQEMEAQKTGMSQEVGVVGLQVIPPTEAPIDVAPDSNETNSIETNPTPEPAPVPEPEIQEPAAEEIISPVPVVTPVTEIPKPPKKRKFFGLFRSSKSDQKETETTEIKTEMEEVVQEPIATSEPTGEEVPLALTEEEQKPVETPVEAEKSEPEPAPELEKIEPKPEQPQTTQQTIAAGNVLLINRVHNFAVINLGSRHGLALNDILHIQREGAAIAKVRVEKLYEDYCAAYIVEEQSGNPIKEGDVAGVA